MIYLDNHATTACDPRVVEAMLPYFLTLYGNPSSPHSFGRQAAAAVEEARGRVATLLGAPSTEIVFTSGATEANNLAIVGAAMQHEQAGGKRRRIVTTAIEHKSVLEPCEYLSSRGWEVIVLPVDGHGKILWDQADEFINRDTLLVSVQAANSEIGTIQEIEKLARLAHAQDALLHCDAAQAVGKIPVNVEQWHVDLLSLSSHKLYGPKGVGVLYVRGEGQVKGLAPILRGGSQEQGLRPGTIPVPLVIGLGMACQLATANLQEEQTRLQNMRDELESKLLQALPFIQINGNTALRLPHNSSITFKGIEAEALMANLPNIALSTGAACESGSLDPSRVLLSLGLSHDEAFCTVRIGLGRFSTQQDMELAALEIIEAAQLLEAMLS